MSIGGSSALGTLLVQRLDAALGTTLSQQANIVSGARPDAVSQPGQPERTDATHNQLIRDPRAAVDRVQDQTRHTGRHTVDRAALDARAAALLGGRAAVSTSATPSAPTSLGAAARSILALLASYPDQSPAVRGSSPLLQHAGAQNAAAEAPAGRRMDATVPAMRAAASASATSNNASTGVTAAGAAPAPYAGVASQLAQALVQVLHTSGMFYESHLGGLVSGKQTLAQLKQEPQALAGRSTATANTATSAGPHTGTVAGTPAAESNHAATMRDYASSASAGTASNTSTNTATQSNPVPGVDPQTHILVRQQLEVLANQTFAWRGEAWPEAPMEWEVSRHEQSRTEGDSASPAHWATKITIELPRLGSVQARLTLSGQQVVMHVVAPESAAVLDEHSEILRGRCLDHGLQLSQLSIVGEALDAGATEPSET